MLKETWLKKKVARLAGTNVVGQHARGVMCAFGTALPFKKGVNDQPSEEPMVFQFKTTLMRVQMSVARVTGPSPKHRRTAFNKSKSVHG